MRIDADGPPQGGVCQFRNWPRPGIALRGDEAASIARTLRAIADRRVSPETARSWLISRAQVFERAEEMAYADR